MADFYGEGETTSGSEAETRAKLHEIQRRVNAQHAAQGYPPMYPDVPAEMDPSEVRSAEAMSAEAAPAEMDAAVNEAKAAPASAPPVSKTTTKPGRKKSGKTPTQE